MQIRKFTQPVSFYLFVSTRTQEKSNNKFTNLKKGEKTSPAPAWQVSRGGVERPRTRFFVSFCYMLNYGLKFPYSPIHLLCMHVSTQFISTTCVKWYEIAACIINVWGYIYMEILPNMDFLALVSCGHFHYKIFSKKARAKQERLTVEFEGESLRIRRSGKHHNRYWPCAQSLTSIRMSSGTGFLGVASQGLSRLFLKTFAAVFEPNWSPLGLCLSEDARLLVRCRKCN